MLITLSILLLAAIITIYFLYLRINAVQHTIREREDIISQQVHQIKLQSNEVESVNDEIDLILQSLEETILKRTEKLEHQNNLLKKYAFTNAHKVRAPLARILGIADLLRKHESLSEPQKNDFLENIVASSTELDKVVRQIGQVLAQDFPVENDVNSTLEKIEKSETGDSTKS